MNQFSDLSCRPKTRSVNLKMYGGVNGTSYQTNSSKGVNVLSSDSSDNDSIRQVNMVPRLKSRKKHTPSQSAFRTVPAESTESMLSNTDSDPFVLLRNDLLKLRLLSVRAADSSSDTDSHGSENNWCNRTSASSMSDSQMEAKRKQDIQEKLKSYAGSKLRSHIKPPSQLSSSQEGVNSNQTGTQDWTLGGNSVGLELRQGNHDSTKPVNSHSLMATREMDSSRFPTNYARGKAENPMSQLSTHADSLLSKTFRIFFLFMFKVTLVHQIS